MPESSHAPGPVEPEPAPRGGGFSFGRVLGGIVLLAVLAVLARSLGGRIPEIVAWVNGLGALAPIVFIGVYAMGVVCFVPGSALTLAAGALFGVPKGLAIAWVAATIGASLSFLIARHLARSAIQERISQNPRFSAIDRAVGREGRKIVFLLRLSPVFPFSLLNYALGLTRVGFTDYAIACLGMLPGTLLYVYYGQLLGLAAQLAGGVRPERGAADWALLGLGLIATIAVTIVITRVARRALAQATDG